MISYTNTCTFTVRDPFKCDVKEAEKPKDQNYLNQQWLNDHCVNMFTRQQKLYNDNILNVENKNKRGKLLLKKLTVRMKGTNKTAET